MNPRAYSRRVQTQLIDSLEFGNRPIHEGALTLGGRLLMRHWLKTGGICGYLVFGKILYTVQPCAAFRGMEVK